MEAQKRKTARAHGIRSLESAVPARAFWVTVFYSTKFDDTNFDGTKVDVTKMDDTDIDGTKRPWAMVHGF